MFAIFVYLQSSMFTALDAIKSRPPQIDGSQIENNRETIKLWIILWIYKKEHLFDTFHAPSLKLFRPTIASTHFIFCIGRKFPCRIAQLGEINGRN